MDPKRKIEDLIKRAVDEDMDSIELVDAIMQLEALRDDDSDSAEPDALVCAPLKPQPHLNSGGISLPEPDDPYLAL